MDITYELWAAFKRVQGYLLAVVGTAFSIFPYFFDSTFEISIKAAIPIFMILVISIATLLEALRERSNWLPSVKQARSPLSIYPKSVALLLLGSSHYFGNGMGVLVYIMENDFEILIGYGEVVNVQKNKLIQVAAFETADIYSEWKGIVNNDANLIKKLLVKPGKNNI